jgi:hypothetical protein
MGLAGCMNLVVNLLAIISLFYIYIYTPLRSSELSFTLSASTDEDCTT